MIPTKGQNKAIFTNKDLLDFSMIWFFSNLWILFKHITILMKFEIAITIKKYTGIIVFVFFPIQYK